MWYNNTLLILRTYINDTVIPYIYDDERLIQLIYTSSYIVNNELDFSEIYNIHPFNKTISPEPTDSNFLYLIALHAAVTILRNEAKAQSLSSISVTKGSNVINTTGIFKDKKALADDFQKIYDKAKLDYAAGNGIAGAAVTGPDTIEYLPTIQGNF